MATVTLRPNATVQSDSLGASLQIIGGAASCHAATSDDSDATYLSHSNSVPNVHRLALGFGTTTLPALAIVKTVTPRLRWGKAGGTNASFSFGVRVSGGTVQNIATYLNADVTVHTDTYGALTTNPSGTAWSQADIDGLEAVIDASGWYYAYEAYFDVVTNEAPVVSAITPSGTLTTTARPTIGWTYSDPETDAQERFRVKIYQGTGTVADPDNTAAYVDSTETFNATPSWTPSSSLPAGSYRVYVKAADVGSGGRYSAWATQTFTISIEVPQAPAVVATTDNTLARVAIQVNGKENFLTANQSSLETNTTGWEAVPTTGNVTIARSTAQATHGAASLSMTSIASGTMQARTTITSGAVTVTAGRQYSALASFRAATAGRSVRVSIAWYTAGDVVIGSPSDGSTVTDTTTGWTQATVTATAPANAAKAYVILTVLSTAAASEVHYADKIGFHPGAVTTWSKGGFAGIVFIVEKSIDGGTTWTAVRGAASVTVPTTPSQETTFYDYEVARGVTPRYRARTQALDLELVATLVSADSAVSIAAVVAATGWWLKDPLAPGLNMVIDVVPGFSFRRKQPQSVFEPIGRTVAVVVTDGPRGIEGTLDVWVKDSARYAKLQALVTGGRVLWLEDPFGRAWYVMFGAATEWSLLRAQPLNTETTPIRHIHTVSLPFIEVGSPSGDTVAAGTPTG